MRYFLLGFLLLVVLAVSMAGCRGGWSRRPPIELFADMVRQPKLRPQAPSGAFGDGLSSRRPEPGTIPQAAPALVGGRLIYAFEDIPYNTGRSPGTTNFIETLPVPVTVELLARGRERFAIHCAVCHGAAGDGRGVCAKYQMVGMANFHDRRLVAMTDGEIFKTVTLGKNLMGAYGGSVAVADRWAIVAYVRALERSRLGLLEDVPQVERDRMR